MTDRRFNPGRALTIAAGLGLIVLLALGTWQARKVAPKTALIDSIEAGLEAPPQDLQQLLASERGRALDYRRVSLTGRFTHSDPMPLFGTNLGGKSGYHLYGLMRVEGLGPLVATLGWVGFDADIPPLPATTRRYTGVLVPGGTSGPFTPENDPEGNLWYWADVDAMARAQGADTGISHRLVLDDLAIDDGVSGGQVRVDIPNDHFEYALTWYGLAVTLLGVYIAFGLSRGRGD